MHRKKVNAKHLQKNKGVLAQPGDDKNQDFIKYINLIISE